MKILQAVAVSSVETAESNLVSCSRNMPDEIRKEALGFSYPSDAGGVAVHSLKSIVVASTDWVLLNRIVPEDKNDQSKGHVSHTLAILKSELMAALGSPGTCLPTALGFFRTSELAEPSGDETRWLEDEDDLQAASTLQAADSYSQSHLISMLAEMKNEFSEKARANSADTRTQVESIVAELRRDVTALQNRVEEYSNAKWWIFEGEDEIRNRKGEIEQLERNARKASEPQISEYRKKASSVLKALSDAKIPEKGEVLAEPKCFADLLAKFDKLAGDYREFSRIVAICDRANVSDTAEKQLTEANKQLTEQLAETRRELDVSRMSDKIMSSKMKTTRKESARAMAGKSKLMSGQTLALIIVSLALVVSLAMHFLSGAG